MTPPRPARDVASPPRCWRLRRRPHGRGCSGGPAGHRARFPGPGPGGGDRPAAEGRGALSRQRIVPRPVPAVVRVVGVRCGDEAHGTIHVRRRAGSCGTTPSRRASAACSTATPGGSWCGGPRGPGARGAAARTARSPTCSPGAAICSRSSPPRAPGRRDPDRAGAGAGRLRPQKPRDDIEWLRLEIDAATGDVRRVEVADPLGGRMLFELGAPVRESPLPDASFRVTCLPAGRSRADPDRPRRPANRLLSRFRGVLSSPDRAF